jgi:Ser/Thr protein kinase RdoA (MazF antagonist)
MTDDRGEPLAGGNTSLVVRVGDTVRRPAGPWTPAVHDLLRHVRSAGFDLAPEPLGIDDVGREVLSFAPGDNRRRRPSLAGLAWSDRLLEEAGQAARRYHDAVRSFRPARPLLWRAGASTLGEGELVCHNDFAPYNVVTSDGALRAVIDWDFAAPATPLWDLAFMAWQWAPLHHPALAEDLGWSDAAGAGRRLRLLCDAYGLEDRSALVDTIRRRIDASRRGITDGAAARDEVFVRLEAAGHAVDMARTLQHLDAMADRLHQAVTSTGEAGPRRRR